MRLKLLNTSLEQIDLHDIEVPVGVKICAEPGFNESAITKLGNDESKKCPNYPNSEFLSY